MVSHRKEGKGKMLYQFYDYIKSKYFETLSGMTPVEREAEIFRKTCEEIPISIKEGDLFCGRYGCENEEAYQPQASCGFEWFESFTPEELSIKQALDERYAIRLSFQRGHCLIDYGKIIRSGLKAYVVKVEEELKKEDNSAEKRRLLLAMLAAVEGVRIYMCRFSRLAEQRYEETGDPIYLRMKQTMDRVPYEPCRDFYEAICAVWTMHSLIPISDNSWASISLGRFDQYMLPFYREEENKEEVKKLLRNLFTYLNLYGDGACALNIGGLSAEGEDEINELSLLLIEVEKELCMSSPILAVR